MDKYLIAFPKSSRYPWFPLILLLLTGSWILLSPVQGGTTTQGSIPAPQPGFLAPDFNLQNPQGEWVRLSDLRGQAVVINLWASWCGPCRAEMPAIQRVYDTYKERGFTVLAVNATQQDSQSGALTFIDEYQLTFPILFDIDGTVSKLYNLRALPSTYFVNRMGYIEEVIIGGPMAEALLSTRVESLLEE